VRDNAPILQRNPQFGDRRMSKYPVPIFQPTIPHDCHSNPLWLEQIHSWMSLQLERQEGFRRQLETQNHLLIQLNRRLDRVFLKLATIELEPSRVDSPSPDIQSSGSPESTRGARFAEEEDFAGEELTSEPENRRASRPAPAGGGEKRKNSAGVSSWMQQREAMLKCLVAQLEIEESLYPSQIPAEQPGQADQLEGTIKLSLQPPPKELQQDELVEIEALKEQLQAAIREMEVECSVQRAKLSHEQARLSAREADLERREKKFFQDSRQQLVAEERADPLVSRIKGILRRG
jgi:hypothetical protein